MKVLSVKKNKLALDVKDWRIVKELISNVRQPVTQIAKKCLISRQSAEYRINQLKEKELFIGYRSVINIKKLNFK